MMKKVTTLLILCLVSMNLWAFGLEEATVLYKSTSEKTLALDLGELEEYKEGDFGKIFIQRGDYNRPTLFLLGVGKIVKTFPTKSIWLMSKNYIKNKMEVDEKVLVMLSSKNAVGRKTLFHQKQVIFNKDSYSDVDDFLDQNHNNVPEKYIAHEQDYEISDNIFDEKKVAALEMEFSTYDSYKKFGTIKESDEYKDEIKGLAYFVNDKFKIGDLQKAEDLKLLESDSKLLINKINSQRFGLSNGLYRSHKKTPGSHELNDHLTISNVYEESKASNREKNVIDPKAVAKIERDGELWSADMDEDTLRRYFITSGILNERNRKTITMNELEGHEIMFSYSGNANTHAVSQEIDPAYQVTGYDLSIGYDLHLYQTSPNLKDWSIQFVVERGVKYYDIGGQNARSEEGEYGAYLNYYFFNNPLTLNQFIWEAGVGLKLGMAQITSEKISKAYDYQVLTVPSLQILTKYRMRAGDLNEDTLKIGVAVNAGVVFESKNLRIVNDPVDNINSKINANDLKYQFGFSFYF